MYTAMDLVVSSLSLVHPDQPYEWIHRAATEMVAFADRYPEPTMEQRMALDERVRKMCTTGEW
ncbi:hypothetical protein HUN41_00223 [Streptomyces phage Coruscant]|uniref:Uncharacterized protein n=1 Tax=Streptomyces phage Coruscant TaxID=2739834 RepID=A0A7G4AWC5_9CAUD|nr:hypothetical protein PP454_gp102 [Streptomyces phage Coruscant]QMP84315.1 hypothetical protein HUN41_00223 [Streptomyces phage Coruscant]